MMYFVYLLIEEIIKTMDHSISYVHNICLNAIFITLDTYFRFKTGL